jgi:hypothetical protein
VGKTVYDASGLFVLNELGAFIWKQIPEAENEEEICNAVLEMYDVTREEVSQDVAKFLEKLKEMNII